MKIVLFSPLANTSAIGRVTALIVPALIELGHTLTLVRTEQVHILSAPPHACTAPIIEWTNEPAVEEATHDADALVYQIGNNYDFHCGGLHWLAKRPGIVCLHDFVVAHLFAGWAETRRAEADEVLHSWYGKSVAQSFFAARDHREFIDTASRDHPMTEWICAMAQGVISHSRWGMPRVLRSTAWPARVAALPYNAPAARPAAERVGNRVKVLTVGHANVNKRIESVIRAIGESAELRGRIEYQLCGRIEPRYALELARAARAVGVRLRVSGEIDDLELQMAMNEADIVCSLRWPSLEAASATAIEGMLYGKAMVVTDTGFYSELPDDCVCKISIGDEIGELRQVLERLVAEPSACHAMAARAQRWAEATFTARNYAAQIEGMTRLVRSAEPAVAAAGTLAGYMNDWGASSDLLLTDEITKPLEIFDLRD
ncbi:glycosyltransferase family 4 protein [Variovorax guangxiensis]|uniref:glycosyltransferase family 4 protein n=1 Tax=Variovorax guangxiensis TaxID=1775474 RepID=UPI00285CF7AA|nr:glycosyltransferase family 4 protein [Variovorax guangxiensis]MDR6857575.1 glycosyltransferase involved in cell wall biosynthesis [Variovorax guangxiensis]